VAWILEAEPLLGGLLSEPGYLAPFLVLVLCGFGLPVPEEITMLGAGFLLYQGEVDAAPIIAVCFAGTLLGDSVPFMVGRRFGRRALRNKAIRRAVHPERLRAIERRFDRQGPLAVFVCRFIPGLRLPTWFTAGSLGMPYLKFIAFDGLGAAILTPTLILLGRESGEQLAELEARIDDLHQILGFVVLALVAILLSHLWISRRWQGQPRRTPDSARAKGAEAPPDGDRP
jgi:membrane protein DedA with SNARE-associated domain